MISFPQNVVNAKRNERRDGLVKSRNNHGEDMEKAIFFTWTGMTPIHIQNISIHP